MHHLQINGYTDPTKLTFKCKEQILSTFYLYVNISIAVISAIIYYFHTHPQMACTSPSHKLTQRPKLLTSKCKKKFLSTFYHYVNISIALLYQLSPFISTPIHKWSAHHLHTNGHKDLTKLLMFKCKKNPLNFLPLCKHINRLYISDITYHFHHPSTNGICITFKQTDTKT